MHFQAGSDFTAPPERVGELMSDPDFQSQVELPDLSAPTVVAYEVDGTQRLLRLRYQYVGQIDSFAQRIVGNRQLTWVQELRLDLTTGVGAMAFSADEDAGRVNGEATVAITPTDTGAHRAIAGDFHIRIPRGRAYRREEDRARARAPAPRRSRGARGPHRRRRLKPADRTWTRRPTRSRRPSPRCCSTRSSTGATATSSSPPTGA